MKLWENFLLCRATIKSDILYTHFLPLSSTFFLGDVPPLSTVDFYDVFHRLQSLLFFFCFRRRGRTAERKEI